MSRPDERLVEGVDYDHGDYDAVAEGEFTGYGDHEDRPWADDDRDDPQWDDEGAVMTARDLAVNARDDAPVDAADLDYDDDPEGDG